MKFSLVAFFSFTIGNVGCNYTNLTSQSPLDSSTNVTNIIPKDFTDYWYAGAAEVNAYDLEQSRYGEIRKGDAVMVFVTEDFSKSKQVKLDYPQKVALDAVSVLKLNQMKRFHTGIYDYSIMLSAFTPVDIRSYPHSFKTTFSSQDWCGQVFSQLNLEKAGAYRFQGMSYFESEGDQSESIRCTMLEDEIWNRLRIDPQSVPVGDVLLIPSMSFARLQHKGVNASTARISFNNETESTSELQIDYIHFERSVSITFENSFPFKILGWVEQNGNEPPTKATLRKTIKSPYWSKNSNEFAALRDSLGLKF